MKAQKQAARNACHCHAMSRCALTLQVNPVSVKRIEKIGNANVCRMWHNHCTTSLCGTGCFFQCSSYDQKVLLVRARIPKKRPTKKKCRKAVHSLPSQSTIVAKTGYRDEERLCSAAFTLLSRTWQGRAQTIQQRKTITPEAITHDPCLWRPLGDQSVKTWSATSCEFLCECPFMMLTQILSRQTCLQFVFPILCFLGLKNPNHMPHLHCNFNAGIEHFGMMLMKCWPLLPWPYVLQTLLVSRKRSPLWSRNRYSQTQS